MPEPLDPLFLITIEEPTQNLREAIQEMVKQNAEEWWHQMPDVWIVQGGSVVDWRDRLLPLRTAAGVNSRGLVLQLPKPFGGRSWAATGQTAAKEFSWFPENYTPRSE